MSPRKTCLGIASALALLGLSAGLSSGTQAAPRSGAPELKADATTAAIEKAAYRRCWWRYGHRVCRWVGGPYYDDEYYGGGPYVYGYAPFVGFGFGGGHHHHGHHWR
jgi:hypothetical protein